MSGKLMPGQQLALRPTAEALNVSVMPVREATQRLVAEKALEIGPSRIARVPMMTISQFQEITSLRIILEGFAVEQACLRIDEASLLEIEALVMASENELAQENPDGTQLININKDLHFSIYRAAEMPILLHSIEALWLRIGPFLNYDSRSYSKRLETRGAGDHYGRLLKSFSHHTQMVQAVRAKDADAATAALRGDIEDAARFILSSGSLDAAD